MEGKKVKGKTWKIVENYKNRTSSQNRCFVLPSTENIMKIVDIVEKLVDNEKSTKIRGFILWKSFVDIVDNFTLYCNIVKKSLVELCNMHKNKDFKNS